jgi:hypothetical protein
MAESRKGLYMCAWCGRMFANPGSESRILNGVRVCRRPCSLRPLYQTEASTGGKADTIRWAGEHVVLTGREVAALQHLLGKGGSHLIEELERGKPMDRTLRSALRRLGTAFTPSRSPVTFVLAPEARAHWSLRFVRSGAPR